MGKTKLVIGTIAVATSMLLSGCGSDTPEGVAEEFASSLSEVNIEKVNSLSSMAVQGKITNLKKICKSLEVQKLGKEALSIANMIGEKTKDEKYDSDIKSFIETRKVEYEAAKKEMKQELQKKYGGKRPSKDVAEKDMERIAQAIIVIYAEFINKEMQLFDIESEQAKQIQDVLAMYMLQMGDAAKIKRGKSFRIHPENTHANIIRNSAKELLSDNAEKVTKQCIQEVTDFGNIDNINFIEVKHNSADEVTVRLELIRENGESEKVFIDVEKIKDEWKVSDLTLHYDFW